MKFFKAALVISILALGVTAVGAQDGIIEDNRVNAWDVSAPVAVYCTFDHPDADDPDYSELETVDLWSINSDGEGRLVLSVDAETLDEVGYSTTADTLVDSTKGFSLNRGTDGSLYVTAPADGEGKVYSFAWEFGDQHC